MYKCTACGGALKFDIRSQKLKCDYCSNLYAPESFDEVSEAADKSQEYGEQMDVNMFSCPSCGGTMYSSDDVAAGFCSFCGASSVLEGRLVKKGRPQYILPFTHTKEDCKESYFKKLRGALYAPKELKDPEFVEEFRGIYMPYWLYGIEQKGEVSIPVSETHREGDYMVTNHYNLRGDIDARYNGLSHDASVQFNDNISESIAPYDVVNKKKFTPSYLSGFYADVADVQPGSYSQDAINAATDNSMFVIKKTGHNSRYKFPANGNNERLHSACKSAELAMFPVWFLAYRKNDRVAYATVNGQTGKVVADIPIDVKKYMLGSILFAIPIFLMLNALFTVIPSVALAIISVISAVTSFLYIMEIWEIEGRDKKRSHNIRSILGVISVICMFFILCSMYASEGSILSLLLPCITVIEWFVGLYTIKSTTEEKNMRAWMGPAFVTAAASVLIIINPASDLWYYGMIILTEIAQLYCLVDLICKYNIVATRKIPQFVTHKGGNDRA